MAAIPKQFRRRSIQRKIEDVRDGEADHAAEASHAIRGAGTAPSALRASHIVALQRTAGNRAVAAAMARPKSLPAPPVPAVPVVQRVTVALIAGLKADDPSTYDSGGGHSYADHGAHTTAEQHVRRVKTGVAPSGRRSPVPPGKGSSKFDSDDKHKAAFQTALADIRAKNARKQKVRGAGNVVSQAGAGTTYFADGSSAAADKVQLDIQSVDDTTIRINSMYPVP